MTDDELKPSPRTAVLEAEAKPIIAEAETVKSEARSALVLLRDVLEALRDTEIDLAAILDSEQTEWNR